MSLKEILTKLPTLKPSELLQVKTRLDFLLSSTTPEVLNQPLDWLTEGMIFELKRRGAFSGEISWDRLMRVAPRAFQARCTAMQNLLLSKAKLLTAVERIALGRVVARALADYLSFHGEVSLKQMLNNIDNVAVALDHSFPEYVSAGMLDFLVQDYKEHGR